MKITNFNDSNLGDNYYGNIKQFFTAHKKSKIDDKWK
jgi:hypothetical protein